MKPASNTKPSRSSRRRPGPRIEVLEPRLLYSADVFGAIDPLSADDPTDRGIEDVTSVLDLSATLDADRPDPTPPPPANPEFTSPRELVFIDTATPDYQTLVDDLSRSGRALEIVLIEPDQNGIDLIGRTLARHQAITAVHLISHGQAGEITLGNTMLNPTQLATHADTIAGWREALSNNADWLIYGCNLTATDEGERFIDEFARLTGADVAASDDLTGNAAKGGDWDLEYATGTIESQIAISQAAQLSWNQVLDISSSLVGHWTLDSDATDSSGNGNTGILAGDAAIDTSSSTNNVGPGKLTLDGSGDYVELSNHAASFDSLTQGTIAGWINTADTTNTQAIFGVADKGDPLSYSALGISQGKLFFDVAEAGGYLIRLNATPVIADGNWHHVAVTVDVNGNSLYIDGVKLASSQLSYTNGDASSTEFFSQVKNIDAVEIGVTGENGGLVWDFKGLLDDIRVYDRALDSGEIAQFYNFQKAPTDITLSQATAVSIANPGFEAQTLAEDQWTGSVTGWDINGTAGVGNPDFSAYSYGVPEGNNLAYLDEDPQHQLSQTLSETFQPGRSYALSAMIGDEIDGGYNPAGWEMRLFAGNQLLGAVNNNDFDPAEGTFEKATLHLSADDLAQYQAYYGQALKIEFYNSGITPGEDVHIDDVQLEYTAISVPENAANGTAVADIASVSDPNTGDTFTYSLADDAGGRFAINSLGEITVADGTLLDYESATSHNITVRATDASGLFYDEIVTIQVADVNDPPVISPPAAGVTYTENDPPVALLPTASVSDVDSADFDGGTLTVGYVGTVSTKDVTGIRNQGTGPGEIGVAGSNVTYGGTVIGSFSGNAPLLVNLNANADQAAVQALVRNITYAFSGDYISTPTRTLRFTLTDGDGGTSAAVDQSVTLTNINDPPINTVPGTQTVTEETQTAISGISVTDPDGLVTDIASIQLSVVNGNLNVTLSGSASITAGSNDSSSLTVTGEYGDLPTVLGTVKYTGNVNVTGVAADTLTIVTNDGGNNGAISPQTDTDSIQIDIVNVNDAPANTLPAAQSANEDTPLSISGVSVTDADDNLSSVRLSVSNGVLNVTLAGAASISAGGNDSADLTLSGSLADINNTLASLIYRSHADFNGSDTLTMVSTDSDGASDSDTMAISVNPVNDGPVINDPNHVFINEIHYDNTGTDSGEAIELAGPNGTDISGWSLVLYNGADGLAYDTKTLSGTFTDQGEGFGTLVFNYATNGIQNGDSAADGIALVDNNGKVVEFLSYEGQFTATNGPAAGLLSSDIGVSESSATPVGDSLQRTGAGPVFTWDNAKPATFGTVNSSQSFSTLAAPLGLQTVTEDTALTFSPATGNIIAIADIDADDSPGDSLQVTVSTSSGSLALGTTSGLSGVAGNGTNNVSFFGRVEEVNAALNGLAYTPAPNYSGSDTLTIEVNDQGNTGGSILSDTMTVNLTVVPVNDAPTLAGIEGSPLTHTENDPASIVSSAITVTDVDDTNIESATIQIAGNYQSGEDLLSFTDTTNITGHWDAATGTLSLSGSDTLANYQAALRTVAYVNTSDNPSTLTRSATFTVNDGTASSNVQTRNITLSPVNDEQSLDTNAGMTVDEEATATITSTMLSTSDVEQSPAQIIYTVASVPANGALKLDGAPLSASNIFTQDDIDNGRLVYAHNGSETTADSFTFTVDDGFGTAASGTFNITVNPVNDAPVATVDSFSVAEGSTTTLDIANNDYDPDDGLDPASIVIDTLPSHGTLSINNDGTVGYVHDGSETTSDNFVYRISDNSGAQSHSVLVSLTVTPVNDAPAFDSRPIVAATENSLYTYDIVTNDPDAGTTLTFTSTNLPVWLTLTDHGDGTATLSGTPGNGDVGSHNISLEVSDGSLTAAQTFTLTVFNTNSPPLGLPSITGTPTEDQTLTVDVSAISDGDGLGPFNYQWLRNGAAISGAASASHILGDADVGAQISVRVSYTDGDGNLETLISDPTAAIANINDAPTGSVLIDNPHPAPGDTLAISHTLADDDGFPGAVNYQWQRDGADIPGATGSTYTVTPGDIGKPVTVTLTYTDGHGTLEAVTAAPVIPVNSGGGTSSGGGSANIPPEITSGGGENTAAVAILENQTSVTTVVAVDPDGDKPTLTISGGADHGLFQIDVTTGQLSFTAPPDYENPSDENHDGVYQVAITALDPDGGSDTQTLLISVKNINEKPDITSLPMDEISEADVYQYQVRASDPDDSQNLAWTAAGLPPWLNLEDQGDGSAILRGQPEAGGEYLISLQVSDGELSAIQTFLLKVTPAGPVTPDPGEVAKPEPDEPAPSTPLDEPGNTGGPTPIIPPEEVTPPVSPPHPGNPSDITDMTDETPPPPTLALIATIDPSTSQEAWNFARKLSPGSESTHFPPPAVEADPTAHELSLPLADNINLLPKEDGVSLPVHPGTGPVAALESKLEEPSTNPSGDKSIQAGDTAPVSPVLQPGTNTRFPEPLPLNHHLFANLADIERFSSKSPVTPNPTADHPPMDNRHPQGSPFGVPKTAVNPIAFVDIPENSAFMNDLDQTRQDLDRDAEKQAEASKLSVQTATGISLAFSAGVVHWALRPNSLLAGFLSALPFWKQVDPLPILGASDPNGSKPEPPEPASQKHDGPVETLFDNEPTSPPDSHREQP